MDVTRTMSNEPDKEGHRLKSELVLLIMCLFLKESDVKITLFSIGQWSLTSETDIYKESGQKGIKWRSPRREKETRLLSYCSFFLRFISTSLVYSKRSAYCYNLLIDKSIILEYFSLFCQLFVNPESKIT